MKVYTQLHMERKEPKRRFNSHVEINENTKSKINNA